MLSKLLKKGVSVAKPLALYVNNVQFCKSTASNNILPIAKIDNLFLSAALQVFEWNTIDDSNIHIVILTEPKDINKKYRSVESILPVLRKYGDSCMVRLHPRDLNKEQYNGFKFDSQNSMWEMRIAMTEKFDDYILIGPNSTAQLTPKLFFNKEPYLIFTHYFADYLNEVDIKKMDDSIEDIKKMYINKDKVFCPKNISELDEAISKALSMVTIRNI